MYNLVTPQEWELMEHMKNGEEIGNCDKTCHAILYEAYVESPRNAENELRRSITDVRTANSL